MFSVIPIPTENKRSCFHPRIAVSIVPVVISIIKSIPLLNYRLIRMYVLFGRANVCQMIMASAHLAVLGIFLCSHFQTCVHRKKCPETFYIKLYFISKQQSAGPKMHCGRTGDIIAASDFEEHEVRDVIMGKFLIAFGVQQYDNFLQWIHCLLINFLCVLRGVKTGFDLLP